jgi:hypothetical protein
MRFTSKHGQQVSIFAFIFNLRPYSAARHRCRPGFHAGRILTSSPRLCCAAAAPWRTLGRTADGLAAASAQCCEAATTTGPRGRGAGVDAPCHIGKAVQGDPGLISRPRLVSEIECKISSTASKYCSPFNLRLYMSASQEAAAGKAEPTRGRWSNLRAAEEGAVERASTALQSGANVLLSLDGAVSPPSPVGPRKYLGCVTPASLLFIYLLSLILACSYALSALRLLLPISHLPSSLPPTSQETIQDNNLRLKMCVNNVAVDICPALLAGTHCPRRALIWPAAA